MPEFVRIFGPNAPPPDFLLAFAALFVTLTVLGALRSLFGGIRRSPRREVYREVYREYREVREKVVVKEKPRKQEVTVRYVYVFDDRYRRFPPSRPQGRRQGQRRGQQRQRSRRQRR